jgi:hypothetical protein
LNEQRVIVVSSGCLFLGLYYLAKVGPANVFLARNDFTRVRAAVWPDPATCALITSASTGALLVALAGLLQVRRQDRREGKAAVTVLTILVSIMLLIVINPISTARYGFGSAALSVAAMLGAFATPHRFRVSAVVLLAGLILVFPYADRYRNSTSGSLLSKGGVTQTLTSGDYDAYAQINNTIYYMRTEKPIYGRQALGVALFWVPRKYWPHKPQDTGIVLAEARGYGFTNLSAPLWSEMLINGGAPLVLVGFSALGFWFRRAGERQERSGGPLGILGCIIPFYALILFRGSLLQATGGLAMFLVAARLIQSGAPDDSQALATVAEVGSADRNDPARPSILITVGEEFSGVKG